MRLALGCAVFGVIATFLGMFLGLQVSPWFGNVLLFPFVAAAWVTGEGFGQLPTGVQVALYLATSAFWAVTAYLGVRALRGSRSRP